MSEILKGKIVEILPTKIWIENDLFGGRHVMLQHEGCHSFTYASFGYDYAYTSNSTTFEMAKNLALSLGATEPVEQKTRGFSESEITPPHRKPWVGLTLEDKNEFVAQDFGGNRLDALDWAEKRLKEKNHG